MPAQHILEDIANDLALWIDQTATEVALAFAPARSPFSAKVSESDKLEFYKAQLFNPDGSPNAAGRNMQLQRLGTNGFAQVYQAVIKRYPELRPPPQPEIAVPEEWPQLPPGANLPGAPGAPPAPAGPMSPPPGGPPMPPGGPGPGPMPPPPMMPRGAGFGAPGRPPPVPGLVRPPGISAMASGGIVTKPTVALIGEAGPEAVVPLPDYQPPTPDPDLQARLGGAPGADATPSTPSHDEISAYIQQAAAQRGIDPNVALRVALHEGTNPATGRFDSPAEQGTFDTGRSWWPYQLHYGGAGTPYEQYGNVAGMGNDFTQRTGWQPGDPRAWKDATNYALDQAVANPTGWGLFYGSGPAKVAPRQGLPAPRR